eukprot:c2662_g1_i1.p1 GENE.c2662_g1_i1~~c2662_g1_i1.p1  ORF type:complete len:494 (+),score=80.98 c2662_g1_i1:207-1484(+)
MSDSPTRLTWQRLQCFGDPSGTSPQPGEIVSACAFDKSGQYLAAGNHGGMVVIWAQQSEPSSESRLDFKAETEICSHEQEFDVLTSQEIPAQIKHIQWLPQLAKSRLIMSANDKTIKIWKIYEKSSWLPPEHITAAPTNTITVPRSSFLGSETCTKAQTVFTNGHRYTINSLSLCTDSQTFLSSDDLRINIWDLNTTQLTANILDITPQNGESDNVPLISKAAFSPHLCNEFLYGCTDGSVSLCDLRQSFLCQPAREFRAPPQQVTCLTPFLVPITSIKHHPTNPRIFMTRDYMTIKFWDTAMERAPLGVIKIHESLRSQFAELYESEYLMKDDFDCGWSPDGRFVLTGSYNNFFHCWNCTDSFNGDGHSWFQAVPRRRSRTLPSTLNIHTKCQRVAWHPVVESRLCLVCTLSAIWILKAVGGHA